MPPACLAQRAQWAQAAAMRLRAVGEAARVCRVDLVTYERMRRLVATAPGVTYVVCTRDGETWDAEGPGALARCQARARPWPWRGYRTFAVTRPVDD